MKVVIGGAGVPVGIQSQFEISEIGMEALFILQVGHNEWNSELNDAVWNTLAESDPKLYQELYLPHMYEEFDINPARYTPWNPSLHSVTPEPSSDILFLIGLSFLLLKRPKSFT